jgi:tetratricopeptide (TPR) repeat protein
VHPKGGNVTDQPRIFVSAVSCEFSSARKQVAEVLTRLRCEPVWQEMTGNEPDDLRPLLRDKIRSCDGLIQIVGEAYGPEPTVPDRKLGRVSYAQFEYLFARQKGKKTWLILAELREIDGLGGSSFDKPTDPNHPDSEGYQLERQILQEEYRERVEAGNPKLLEASNESEILGHVEQLRNELSRLHTARESRRLRGKRALAAAAVLLVTAAILGSAWSVVCAYNNGLVASTLATLRPDWIRLHLAQSIRAAFDRQTAEALATADTGSRQKITRQAEQARDQELAQLEPTVAFLSGTIARGEASPEFVEMLRLLQEESADSALAYLSSQEQHLLGNDDDLWKAMPPGKARRALAPILAETVLLRQRGDLPAAGRICERLLTDNSDWPDAQFQHAMTMMTLGERALGEERQTAAWQRFASARSSADRLVESKQTDPLVSGSLSRLYHRLGVLSQDAGRLEETLAIYTKQLECAKKWAASEPNNVAAQRELMIVFVKVGELNIRRGQFQMAEEFHAQGLAIAEKLAAGDSSTLEAKRELSISYVKIGEMWQQLGIFRRASKYYAKSLSIQKQFADANPADDLLQQQLAESYERLVSANRQDVRELSQKALEVRAKRAAAHPADMQLKRELAAAYDQLAIATPANLSPEVLEQGLVIRKSIAAADASVETQRQLSAAYKKTATANIRQGRTERAGALYEENLDLVKKLAAAEPANLEYQSQLSNLYDSLGTVGRQAGRFDAARAFYQQALEIRTKLANAEPTDEGALQDLVTSFLELARLRETTGEFDGAVQVCESGIAEFELLGKTPSLQAQMHRHLVKLQRQLDQCLESRGIVGDLAPLLKRPPDRLPRLLRKRCRLLASRKDIDEVARTAAALRDLEPKKVGNLYDAACGYGLCAKLAAGWPGAGPFEPAKVSGAKKTTGLQPRSAEEEKYRQTAFDLLQQAERGGFLQMSWAPQEQDLAALHGLPEFKTLINRSPKPQKRPFLGG